ncbi:hypothetical protein EIP86_002884 [Pleurotus ostreatoroseus]|nr:hypothetical protein EIP86_002884 [Pleurotus ostreatoroseus]
MVREKPKLSSVVNKAYGTLTNPYTRAEYLLQLQGMTIGESDNLEDPTLIMEVMEAREELESAESREEVERIRQENISKIEELLPVLAAAVTSKDWTSVKEYAVRLKYLQGIDLAAEAWPNQPFDH